MEEKNRNKTYQYIIAGLVAVILILILLLFLIWANHSKRKTDESQMIQDEVIEYTQTLAEEEPTVEESAVKEKETTLQEPDAAEKPYYEDYSYSKEFILKEMTDYWVAGRQDAIYDLAALRRYRKLSYSLKDTKNYYYLGERDAQDRPNGMGLAMYANDTYYYGSFVAGKREGTGAWYRFYFDPSIKGANEGRYTFHSYSGEWKDDLPDGAGAEHFDIDVAAMQDGDITYQNIIGSFKKGRYDGELYCTTLNTEGQQSEWDGSAKEGVFDLVRELTVIGESPIWKNRADETVYLKLPKGENVNRGIQELIEEVEN